MKILFSTMLVGAVAIADAQTDHDNLDAGRPLRFEDAEPVAFRTMALEYGFGLNAPRNRRLGLDGTLEFIYGVHLNGQLELGFDGRDDGRIDAYDIAYLYSFRQEIKNLPALALKVEASLPGLAGEKSNYRLRGIATKTVGRFDRVHLNLDADFQDSARLGGVLGYSHPIGYPREFNTTGLAEIAVHRDTVALGLGVRRQISPRAVLDFGLQSDVAPGRGVTPTPFRLIAGYSTSF